MYGMMVVVGDLSREEEQERNKNIFQDLAPGASLVDGPADAEKRGGGGSGVTHKMRPRKKEEEEMLFPDFSVREFT